MINLLVEHGFDWASLATFQEKPAPFTQGDLPFWDDPHISQQMLKAHLNPDIDAASYRTEMIEKSVGWLVEKLGLDIHTAVLDLGCGPGLYTSRLAKLGMNVTGVDYSRNSIAYAQAEAEKADLPITYRYENYLELADADQYNVAMLISGDYCPLSAENRRTLLGNVRRALRKNGRFVFDVTTPYFQTRLDAKNWYVAETGFWRPDWHLVLEQGFEYPEVDVHLDQYVVVEQSGKTAVYRNWLQAFTAETLTLELEENGFAVEWVGSDLTGSPLVDDSSFVGVIARKI